MQIKEMLITPNKYSRPQTKIGKIKNIVIHWIGNAGTTAENNAKYFDGLKVGKKNSAGKYIYVSSHYIIGNDGVVVRCVPESEVAYHASDANSYSIGVELCMKHNLEPTQAIIRHYDVTGKICPKYYVENVSAFKKLKEEVKGKMGEDKELVAAVKVLQKKGIISSPEVWINGTYTKNNVKDLIIKVSNYIN